MATNIAELQNNHQLFTMYGTNNQYVDRDSTEIHPIFQPTVNQVLKQADLKKSSISVIHLQTNEDKQYSFH